MRAAIVCSLFVAASTVCTGDDKPSAATQADYFVGQVNRVTGSLIEVDLGFAHGFEPGQRLAVFRSDGLAWNPVGVVSMERVQSNRSHVVPVLGQTPRKGDLVLVSQNLLGYFNAKQRATWYVTQRILSRKNRNGYDTSAIATDTRALYRQRRNSRNWFRERERTEPKLNYGTTKSEYESQRVRNLTKQCAFIAELQSEAPGALKSLSSRWTMVLPQITGPTEPAKPANAADQDVDPDNTFATSAQVRNVLPDVRVRFDTEPEAVQEVFALLLGAIQAQPPANTVSYMRLQLQRTQFPQLARQPSTLEELDNFLSALGSN